MNQTEETAENIEKIAQTDSFEELENVEISERKVWSATQTQALPSGEIELSGSSKILFDFIQNLQISNSSKSLVELELSKLRLEFFYARIF